LHVGRIGCGLLKLLLEQVALDLVVVDANGNNDGAEDVIASGEEVADFPGGDVEAANREKSVDASTDQKCEKPGEGDDKEAAELFGMPYGFRIVIARRSRERERGVFGRPGWHISENMPKLGEKRGAKATRYRAACAALRVRT
jgi:hypothetical protein